MDMRNVNRPGGRFLMCRPEHFAVSYAINPWMNPASWARDERAHLAAAREWRALHRRLVDLGAAVEVGLLVIGLANIVPAPASAGTYYDSVCNCRRPDSEYNTRRYERAPARVVNRGERVVQAAQVVSAEVPDRRGEGGVVQAGDEPGVDFRDFRGQNCPQRECEDRRATRHNVAWCYGGIAAAADHNDAALQS